MKRKGFRGFIQKDNRKDKHGQWKQKHTADALTPGMKYAKPGTDEHAIREKVWKKRMQTAHKKAGVARDAIKKLVLTKDSLPWKKDVRKTSLVENIVSVVPIVGRRLQMTPEEELILDVSLSLVTSLEGMMYSGTQLTVKQQDALQDFLDLLYIGLPPEWGVHRLIAHLSNDIKEVSRSRTHLTDVINKYPLPRRQWSQSCSSKRLGLTGYSCGMWKLLHVVTVGIAEQRGGLNLKESGMLGEEARIFSPIQAADTIREYIGEFLICSICRQNFVKNYDDCRNNRRCDRLSEEVEMASIADWKELPVWLWEVHNEVSIRVIQEQKERQSTRVRLFSDKQNPILPQIAVVWPSMETCFLCYNEDGTWDEGEVFLHLESVYWPDIEFDSMSERLVQYDIDGSWRLAFALWTIVFTIVWMLYRCILRSSPGPLMYRARRMVRTSGDKLRSN